MNTGSCGGKNGSTIDVGKRKEQKMKSRRVKIFYIIAVIITASLPILLILSYQSVASILSVDDEIAINVVIGFLPLIFSIILLIFENSKEYSKNFEKTLSDKKKDMNSQIERYNIIMQKSIRKYTCLVSEIKLAFDNINYIKENQEFKDIMDLWEYGFIINTNIVDDYRFRAFMRRKVRDVLLVYKTSDKYDNTIELLGNIERIFTKLEAFGANDNIFIYNLRNQIKFSDTDKSIIRAYCDIFSSGLYYDRACLEFSNAIKLVNSNFETEIRNRIIDKKKFESIIYNFFTRILYYLKSLLVELYILGEFIRKYSLNTVEYFKEKEKELGKLDEYIVIKEFVYGEEYVEKYINKKMVNSWYGI
jgi:hypothetical protein